MTNPDVMIPVPFAQNGLKNPINATRQPDQDAQDATWDAGFPPVTMQRKEVGGLPPNGLDFNGVLHAVSADANHRQKGLSIEFNQDFATAIGGYSVGAKLRLANGAYVESTVAGNTNNPNSSMTGWKFVGAAANLSDLTSAATARTNLGLGTAAVKNATSSATDYDTSKVMSVGAFGLGQSSSAAYGNIGLNILSFTAGGTVDELDRAQFVTLSNDGPIGYPSGLYFPSRNKGHAILGSYADESLYHACIQDITVATPASRVVKRSLVRTSANTTVDSNGFLKSASPIVQLFADKIELNDEAKQQNIVFEKLGVGDYLIKNSSGFAQEGWYIETPKDANGNVLFSVIYTTLENGDISVKTYKKKFDFETVSIVADLDNPVDITENRWIDLRLQELPSVDEEQP